MAKPASIVTSGHGLGQPAAIIINPINTTTAPQKARKNKDVTTKNIENRGTSTKESTNKEDINKILLTGLELKST